MSFKSILISIADTDAAENGLPSALALAERLGARITALHPTFEPSASLPILANAPAVGVVDQLITAMERDAARRAERTHRSFEAASLKLGITPVESFDGAGLAVRYLAVPGIEEDLLAELGRVHDLVLVPHPGDDRQPTPALTAALLRTGRPVLILPAAVPQTVGTRVIVAWNGSIESARALAAAADLIVPGSEVVVATVEEASQVVPSAEDAVSYLEAHGLAAAAKLLMPDGVPIAEALLLEADQCRADLLVMGAYSHSRLRETIFGGVTRDILANLDLPVLMAH